MPWKHGHRCACGAIKIRVRDNLKSGESSVHIVSGLGLGLEGDLYGDMHDDTYTGNY